MKRLAFALLTVSLALTAFLWPTGAQNPITCLPLSVPAVTHSLDANGMNLDQHVVQGQAVKFSVNSTGAAFNVFNESGSNLGIGAIPGLATQGFSASTPDSTTTAESCTDAFWDVNFVVRGSCATLGDVITIYVQKANGTQRTPLVTLRSEGDGVTVIQLQSGLGTVLATSDRGLGSPAHRVAVGAFIPFSAAGGQQTPLLTFNIPQSLMDCRRLVAEIVRGSEQGTTSVVFSDLVVIRNLSGPAASGPGVGIQQPDGSFDGNISSDINRFRPYPTGLICRADDCPAVCPTPTPICPVPTPTPTPTPAPCAECKGGVTQLVLQNTGPAANVVVYNDRDARPDKVLFSGSVSMNGIFTVNGTGRDGKLATDISIFVNGVKNAQIHTSCSQPIGPGQVAGSFVIVSGRSKDGGNLCPLTPPSGGGDFCDTAPGSGRAKTLTIRYTGFNCVSNCHLQGDKVIVSGNPAGAQPVRILVTDLNSSSRVYADMSNVTIGQAVVLSAANAGLTTFGTNTVAKIFSSSGALLSTVQFHTSCSQPLQPGDLYGSLELTGFSR